MCVILGNNSTSCGYLSDLSAASDSLTFFRTVPFKVFFSSLMSPDHLSGANMRRNGQRRLEEPRQARQSGGGRAGSALSV